MFFFACGNMSLVRNAHFSLLKKGIQLKTLGDLCYIILIFIKISKMNRSLFQKYKIFQFVLKMKLNGENKAKENIKLSKL